MSMFSPISIVPRRSFRSKSGFLLGDGGTILKTTKNSYKTKVI